jgi:hypothetical protein
LQAFGPRNHQAEVIYNFDHSSNEKIEITYSSNFVVQGETVRINRVPVGSHKAWAFHPRTGVVTAICRTNEELQPFIASQPQLYGVVVDVTKLTYTASDSFALAMIGSLYCYQQDFFLQTEKEKKKWKKEAVVNYHKRMRYCLPRS